MSVERWLGQVHGGCGADGNLERGLGDAIGKKLRFSPGEEEKPVVRDFR
jgi:hypothetical protein